MIQGSSQRDSRATASISPELRRTVRLLGDSLGQVLREQGGPELFDAVEGLRRRAVRLRGPAHRGGRRSLAAAARRLHPSVGIDVVRAFGTYFLLINLAEEAERIRRLRAHETGEAGPRSDSLAGVVAGLAARGASRASVAQALAQLRIQPVLTAHPSEVRRRSVITHLIRVRGRLGQVHASGLTPAEREQARDGLLRDITALWQTDEVRPVPPTPLQEVAHGLRYLSGSIMDVVPRLRRELDDALAQYFPGLRVPPGALRAGSWMGGDRDGNPLVTHDVTRTTVTLQARAALDRYVTLVDELFGSLSQSVRRVTVSDELRGSLERDRAELPDAAATATRDFPLEPYRQKLYLTAARLAATRRRLADEPAVGAYASAADLASDLDLIARSLAAHGGERQARDEVAPLQDLLASFGFHLAQLDVRQHSAIHAEAVDLVLNDRYGVAGYSEMDEAGREIALLDALAHPLPPREPANEAVAAIAAMRDAQRRLGEDACHTYIISAADGVSDALEVLLLAHEAGLLDPGSEPGRSEGAIRVVPLFESAASLRASGAIVDRLLSLDVHRSTLARWGNVQEIMVGYSDSNKDAGFLAANWELYQAKRRLAEVCARHGVGLMVFHGRGGAIGRGGGPTMRAIRAEPPGVLAARFKSTEQGEVIHTRYGNPDIAHRHLEQIIGAVLRASVEPDPAPSESWIAAMDRLSAAGYRAYRELVYETDGFFDYFIQSTPIREILDLNASSRPAARGQTLSMDSIRAIPWVFSWTQSRAILPGWYGVGTGLSELLGRKQSDREGIRLAREMYRDWAFFASLVDNVQISLAVADIETAAMYAELVDDEDLRQRVFSTIRSEYERSLAAVLAVSDQTELLENLPVLRDAIALRNPYVDPLHAIQVESLRALRRTNGDTAATEQLRYLVHHSINAISAGLQSTG